MPEDSERLLEFLDTVSDNIHDGIVPQGESQSQHIWYLRENVANALGDFGYQLCYDVSLSSHDFYKIVDETKNLIKTSSEFSTSEKE